MVNEGRTSGLASQTLMYTWPCSSRYKAGGSAPEVRKVQVSGDTGSLMYCMCMCMHATEPYLRLLLMLPNLETNKQGSKGFIVVPCAILLSSVCAVIVI